MLTIKAICSTSNAKDEKNATWATLFFNFAHYAVRPWPWILVGLASLVIFPTLTDVNAAFPNLPSAMQGHDVAYAAMMTYLPAGLIGIVLTSLIAAFMSTISTQLNWGSSYVCLLYTSPSPRDLSTSRMPSSA